MAALPSLKDHIFLYPGLYLKEENRLISVISVGRQSRHLQTLNFCSQFLSHTIESWKLGVGLVDSSLPPEMDQHCECGAILSTVHCEHGVQ